MQRLNVKAQHTAAELRHLSRFEDKCRARMRMIGIAETIDGANRETAAARADMSDQALYDAIVRYNAEGLAGLQDRPRPGRPCKLTEDQRTALHEIVLKGPDVEVDGLSSFTRDDVVKIAQDKWNVAYDPTSIGRILRDLGLSRQKTRPCNPKKDPLAAEAFKKGSRRPAENCQYTS